MASDSTKVRRIRRYCIELIDRADKEEERYGPTGMGEWRVKRETAQRILIVLERP